MMIHHHPDVATLMAFSAGTLDTPYSVAIATHLAMSKAGRETVRQLDAIGGALLTEECDAELGVGALDRLMGALGDGETDVVLPEERSASDVPPPLQPYLPGGLESVRWRWTGPGVAIADLAWSADRKSRLMLVRVAAGQKSPEHGHGGQELTLVLRGAYRDRFGVFRPGDIADHDEDVEHQPIAEPGEDCICLMALEAFTFRGRIMRALQPLFGL